DFDGVIADTEPLHFRSLCEVLAEEHVALSEREYYARYLGYDDVGALRAIGVDYGRSWTIDHVATLVIRKAARVEALERDVPVLFPGAEAASRRAPRDSVPSRSARVTTRRNSATPISSSRTSTRSTWTRCGQSLTADERSGPFFALFYL